MTAADAAAAGRTAAEALMVDSCVIKRASGAKTFDAGTGQHAQGTTTIYTGPCQVQSRDVLGQDTSAGERVQVIGRLVVKVPMAVTGVKVGDLATITAVGTGSDPDLVNRTFRVDELFHKTYATARRLVCDEAQS